MRSTACRLALLMALPGLAAPARAQTVGLILNTPDAFVGYTLFEQWQYTTSYLINNEGRIVHTWADHDYPVGHTHYILDNGDLLRPSNPGGNPMFNAGGAAGLIEHLDWDGNLLWDFLYSNSSVRAHHDIEPLPDGNVLILAWEHRSAAQAVAAGRNPALLSSSALWPEHIVEVEPVGASGGNIVWEWHVWDHLIQDFDSTKANHGVVTDHPELLNINAVSSTGADWIHANAVDYNADLDQIAISSAFLSEIFIIDHGTTTAEAASHTGGARGMGGDFLYRWGNPQNYDRGTAGHRKLFHQHDIQWIESGLPGAGNLLLFNNGDGRPGGNYSTVDEIVSTVDVNGDYPVPPAGVPHGPASAIWSYSPSPPFYSAVQSGAQRQPNGNTLVCAATLGTLSEAKAGTDEEVWRYIVPVTSGGPVMQGQGAPFNWVFRVRRYPPDYPGFDGRDLTPGPPVEIDPAVAVALVPEAAVLALQPARPNPFRGGTTISFTLQHAGHVRLDVHDVAGRRVGTLVNGHLAAGDHRVPWAATGVAAGVYTYTLRTAGERRAQRVVLIR